LQVTAKLSGADIEAETLAAKAECSQGADNARHAANNWLSAIRRCEKKGVTQYGTNGQTQLVPVAIGTLSKDLRARSEEILAMQNRIAALEHELRKPVNELQPAEAIQMLKSFMRVDESSEEKPFTLL
jgi:hypothetical protein